jgi:myo-inositol-1(or 4)-monophosphatase
MLKDLGSEYSTWFGHAAARVDDERLLTLTHPSQQQRLAVALAAALDAGRYFCSRLYGDKQVKSKSSPTDLVTDVDPKCEETIRRHIRGAFPEDPILGEESTEPGSAAAHRAATAAMQEERIWVVDPLDGTTNFVQQIPLSAVSIAYAERGCPRVAVIFDPYRSEVFLAVHGAGAYLCREPEAERWLATRERNGHDERDDYDKCDGRDGSATASATDLPGVRMTVSEQVRLQRSVVATGFPSRMPARLTRDPALRVSAEVKSLRAFGTAALHMAYVASGRLDAYWEYDLNAWDLAAGALLVREAGGLVQDIDGSDYDLTVRNVLAAGRSELLEELRKRVAPREIETGAGDE